MSCGILGTRSLPFVIASVFSTYTPYALAGYDEDIAPIMAAKCNSCHASTAPMLGSYSQVKTSIAAIVTSITADPNGPEKDKFMPKGGAKLSDEDIGKIKAWQSANMPENNSSTPATASAPPTGDQPVGDTPPVDPGATPGTDVPSPGTDPSTPTPLVIDLEGNGAFSFASSPVAFDIWGNGVRNLSWPAATSALLAIDLNGNGTIDSGRELFGDGTILQASGKRAADGFAALAQYDSNGDRRIDGNDPVFKKISAWHDRNSNGKTDEGELALVSDLGIESFSLTYERHTNRSQTGAVLPLLLSTYEVRTENGNLRNQILADVFLTDFSAAPAANNK